MDSKFNKLHELAKNAIRSSLTKAEAEHLRAISDWNPSLPMLPSIETPPDEPQELTDVKASVLFDKWGEQRTIRPSFLFWLFTDNYARKMIPLKKIHICNCLIGPSGWNTLADGMYELDLSDTTLPFSLEFDHCVFPNQITFDRATVLGLVFSNCWLYWLQGKNMTVQTDMKLARCQTKLPIDISYSQIGGSVCYREGYGPGIVCDEVTIRQDLKLENLRLEYIVGGKIQARRTKVQGTVTLSNLEEVGLIRMDAAAIYGDLELKEIKFSDTTGSNGFWAPRMVMEGDITWWRCTTNNKTQLWIPNGRASTIGGDDSMRVGPRKLNLDGFEYTDPTGLAGAELVEWLKNQFSWRRQPYEQYARWLRGTNPSKATDVLIAAEKERRRRLGYSSIWSSVMRVTTGYGYRPLRSVGWIVIRVLIGALVFNWAFTTGALPPVGDKEPPTTFNAFIYSLDVFLPVIDFQQADYWIPTGKELGGVLVQCYFWLHIALGWILTTLAVAGFTGLLKGKSE